MGWQRLPISAFLRKSQNWVQPEPDRVYQQIRVRLWGKGLTLRAKVAGADIAAPRQLQACAGQFLISRIDARHGASGIVPDHLDGALVSNDFPCFDIDERVVFPRYLEWYSRTDQFVELCRRASEGSTNRVRLKEARLMETETPVPPLSEQQRMAEKLDRMAMLTDQVNSLQRDIREDWTALLVSLAHRPDIGRAAKEADGWREVALEKILAPAGEPCTVDPECTYPNLGVYSFAKGAFAKPPIEGASTSAKTLYQVRSNQFIYSRLFAFEGAYTIVPSELDGRFVSGEFPSFDIDNESATPSFLAAYFMNSRVWSELSSESIGLGSRRQRVNQKRLLEQRLLLPPIALQRNLGAVFEKYRSILSVNEGRKTAAVLMNSEMRNTFAEPYR